MCTHTFLLGHLVGGLSMWFWFAALMRSKAPMTTGQGLVLWVFATCIIVATIATIRFLRNRT